MLIIILYSAALLLFVASATILWRTPKREDMSAEQQSIIFLQAIIGTLMCLTAIVIKIANFFLASGIPSDDPSALFIFMCVVNTAYLIARRYKVDGSLASYASVRVQTRLLLFVVFFQFVVIGSVGTMTYFYSQADEAALDEARGGLYAIADSRAAHLAGLITDSKAVVEAYASDSGIAACLASIDSDKMICDEQELSEAIATSFKENPTLKLGVVLDKNGIVVGSSDKSLLGQDWSATREFTEHASGGYHSDIMPLTSGDNTQSEVVISRSVVVNGVFLGVVVAHIAPDEYFAVVENRINLGDTGESMVINSQGELLSPRRFTNELFTIMDTPDADKCINDFADNTIETAEGVEVRERDNSPIMFTNKAGRTIIAATSIVEGAVGKIKWCVSVEMGEDEIRAPLRARFIKTTASAIISLVILIVALTKVFDYFFYRLHGKE